RRPHLDRGARRARGGAARERARHRRRPGRREPVRDLVRRPRPRLVVGEFGTIMASDDGGRSFRQQHAPIESTLFGVHFTDARQGWAVGIDGVILRTQDGGATWTSQPAPVAQRSFYDVVVQGRQGWIVGNSGTVLASTDGGASWALEPLPIQLAANWIRALALGPGGGGLAVGAEGLVLRLEGAT